MYNIITALDNVTDNFPFPPDKDWCGAAPSTTQLFKETLSVIDKRKDPDVFSANTQPINVAKKL